MKLPDLHWLPAQGAAELLFLLCHGDGAAPQQMASLAEALRRQYPQAAVLALQGPQALPSEAVHGFRWFDEADPVAGLAAALPGFVAGIRAWAAHFGLDWPCVAMAGFSQGGTLALHAVMTEPQLVGRVLSFGAAPLHRPQGAPKDVCLHLFHGLKDDEVNPAHVVDAAQAWVELEADVTADLLPGIGHELHPELIERAMHQLRTFIPARLWREATQTALAMEQADAQALNSARGAPLH